MYEITYRAKHADNNGMIYGNSIKYVNLDTVYIDHFEIDPDTISINFPNLVDKDGVAIFVSLSPTGIGGDVVKILTYNDITIEEYRNPKVVLWYDDRGQIEYKNISDKKSGDSILFKIYANRGERCEVVGIYGI